MTWRSEIRRTVRTSAVGLFLSVIVLNASQALALELSGRLDWRQRVELSTAVKGVITDISVIAGETVSKGTLLLKLDQRAYNARVLALKSRQNNLLALKAESGREQDRAQELYDRTLLSEHDLQVRKNERIASEAAYDLGVAELVQARLDLQYSRIAAPFDGRILDVLARPGETVVPDVKDKILVIMVETERMYVRSLVGESELELIRNGAPCTVLLAGGIEFPGKVVEIGFEPAAGNDPDRYPLVVEFKTVGAPLRAGQDATIRLP